MSPPTEYPGLTHEQIASLKTIIKAATIEAVKEAVSEAFKQHLQPITPPEPVTPLQPVIALEQPITPPQPLPEPPPSIEKEKEISINGTSDAMPHQASPKDLYKLPTRCQSPANPVLGFQNFDICTKHFAPSMQFGSPLGYIRDAEKMEATGQG